MTPTPPNLIPTRGALRDWVDIYEPMSEAPAEAHFGAALTTISAAIGWKARITWAENSEPCTVNCILEGGSATARKTTVANTAAGLVRLAFGGFDDADARLHVRTQGHTSDRGLLDAIAAKDAEEAALWELEPPPGVVLVWDEFGSILGRPGDTKGVDWMGRIRTTIMQVANGRVSGIQTAGTRLPGHRVSVSILATMTRYELEQRINHGLLRDGFLGRFCLIPHNGRPRQLALPPTISSEAMQKRQRLAEWIRDLAQSREQIDVFQNLTDDAKARRVEWYEHTLTHLEQRCTNEPTETNQALLEAFGRVQTTAMKISAIAAIAEQYDPPIKGLATIRIDREHVDYGIEFAHLLLKEIRSLAGEISDSSDETYCRKVLEYLKRRGEPVGRADLLNSVRGVGGMTKRQRWDAILGLYPDDVDIYTEQTATRTKEIVALAAAS